LAGTILITGANRGIGLELTRQYAQEGWRVLACSRHPEAEELNRAAAAAENRIEIYRLDVTDLRQIRVLAAEIGDVPIDILFNNAGMGGGREQHFGCVYERGHGWLETFKVNTMAPLFMAEAFVDHVAGSRRRIIATMGSIMGSIADNHSGGYYIYRSSKAAVHMVMRSMAADLQPRGIIAVVLHPGWVQTAMGGSGANLSPRDSVIGLRKVLDGLTPRDSGRFFNYDGQELPW
jgi:NAD(P)-dependent dehydrogenase (short-subunit alcohol dehydrogenase family)